MESRFDEKQLEAIINYERIDSIKIKVKLVDEYKHLSVKIHLLSYYYSSMYDEMFILHPYHHLKDNEVNKNISQKYLERNNNYKSLEYIFDNFNLPIEMIFLIARYLN